MHVLFVEPAFPQNQRDFVRGLARSGAQVTGIGERPFEYLDPELKDWMQAYEQVPSVVHQESLHAAVRRCQERGWVDRLEATVEAHVLPALRECARPARSRAPVDADGVPVPRQAGDEGQSLREAGVPCAQSIGATSADEVRALSRRSATR